MLEKSESIAKLAEALSKAQGELSGAKKDSTNPFFKSKYADLESVWDSIRYPLTKNGLSVSQHPIEENGRLGVRSYLLHSSGEYIVSTVFATPVKADPQSLGSLISYLRRYALAAIVGVYQTDDDAEGASGRNHKDSREKIRTTVQDAQSSGGSSRNDSGDGQSVSTCGNAELQQVKEVVEKSGIQKEYVTTELKRLFNVERLGKLPIDRFEEFLNHLKASVAVKEEFNLKGVQQ